MVQQHTVTEALNVSRSSSCFGNMLIPSEQCSPSADLETVTPKKTSTVILTGGGGGGGGGSMAYNSSPISSRYLSTRKLYDDSDESSISCDSLNSAEVNTSNTTVCITTIPKSRVNRHHRLPIEDNKTNVISINNVVINDTTTYEVTNFNNNYTPSSASTNHSNVSLTSIRGNSRSALTPVVTECTYEERRKHQEHNNNKQHHTVQYLYEDDQHYKFHINERDEIVKNDSESRDKSVDSDDECFAGYKILEKEAIRSAKGTVRGVKNRVRAGIATFLQSPTSKNYKAKDAGKVVVYTTTMGIVRDTYYRCILVKQILKTHMVKYEERDMYMSTELQMELKDRINSATIEVPQLFIDGQYIGDANIVERLNESGELRMMLKPYKSPDACNICKVCGGYQLLPCPVCNGSKKSMHRNDFTTEFIALKCMNCDEVGLVRCQHC